jgi:hypothetical protein
MAKKQEQEVKQNITTGDMIKKAQVLELPNSGTWLTDYDLGAKLDDLRVKYKIKSIYLSHKSVVIEIFKEA